MENEFYDEPRNCSECKVVTYCDRCPICGRLLPRSSASAWVAKFGKRTAGEEDVLQSRTEGSLREHIEVHPDCNTQNVFEYAKVKEPIYQKNKRSNHSHEQHPYASNEGDKKQKTSMNVIAVIIAIFLIVCVVVSIFSIKVFRSESMTKQTIQESTIFNQEAVVDGQNEIKVIEYRQEEEVGKCVIQNTGTRTFQASLELYQEDKMIGLYDDFILMPNETKEIIITTTGEATSYRFTKYVFHEISSIIPDFEFTTQNDFGLIQVETTSNITRHDLEILTNYLYEASSFLSYEAMFSLDVFIDETLVYEAYIADRESVALVKENNEQGKIIDSFEIELSAEI